jgi:DNA modification methylase
VNSTKSVLNRYLIHDSRKMLELLPDQPFVNVTVTSPPYWDRRDYGSKRQIGFGQSYEVYLDDLEKVFRSIHSITVDKGSLWVISDTIKQDGELRLLPFELAARLKTAGWILQDIIIWNKDRTLPWSHQGKLRNIFEYIAFYSKGPTFNYYLDRVRDVTELRDWWIRYPERYSPKGKAPTRTWTIPIPRQGCWGNNWVRHFCPLPPELVKRILLLTTNKGDVVLDPFSGSGAVLAQADSMNRNYVGLDLNPQYRRMFQRKVLPTIRALHDRNQTSSDAQPRSIVNKRSFNKAIRSLRKTKFAKELIRLYRKKYTFLHLDAVLTLRSDKPNEIDVIFLFGADSRIPPQFLYQAQQLCGKPPLSKYGLTPNLKAVLSQRVTPRWLERKGLSLSAKMYLYSRGCTYEWSERCTVGTIAELSRTRAWTPYTNGYPPLLSDVGVRISTKSSHDKKENDE